MEVSSGINNAQAINDSESRYRASNECNASNARMASAFVSGLLSFNT